MISAKELNPSFILTEFLEKLDNQESISPAEYNSIKTLIVNQIKIEFINKSYLALPDDLEEVYSRVIDSILKNKPKTYIWIEQSIHGCVINQIRNQRKKKVKALKDKDLESNSIRFTSIPYCEAVEISLDYYSRMKKVSAHFRSNYPDASSVLDAVEEYYYPER